MERGGEFSWMSVQVVFSYPGQLKVQGFRSGNMICSCDLEDVSSLQKKAKESQVFNHQGAFRMAPSFCMVQIQIQSTE